MSTPPPGGTDPRGFDAPLDSTTLGRALGAVLRMGTMMLAAGTASYRVKEAMQNTAGALGIQRLGAAVTLTEITATSRQGSNFRTEVVEIRSTGVNADRIANLDRLQRSLPKRSTPQDVHRRLDAVEARGHLYPGWANSLFAGVACSAFSVLNHMRFFDVLAVFVAATLGQTARRFLAHRGFNPFGTTMVAAALASFIYLVALEGIGAATDAVALHPSGYVTAVLFLVPGFAFVTGVLDLAKLDFSAALSRTAYAALILLAASSSIWVISAVAGVELTPGSPAELAVGWEILVRGLASGVGVLGFALMFNSPMRMALCAAAIGAVANVTRLYLMDAGWSAPSATALMAIVIGVLAAWVARRIGSPIITLSVPAVLIMVPGISAYRAAVSFTGGDAIGGLAYAVEALFVAVSIAVGLVIAKLATDREWAFEKAT